MLEPTLLGLGLSVAGKVAGPCLDWLTQRGARLERREEQLLQGLVTECERLRALENEWRRDNYALATRLERLQDDLEHEREAVRLAAQDRERLREAWERQAAEQGEQIRAQASQIRLLRERLSLHEETCDPSDKNSSRST